MYPSARASRVKFHLGITFAMGCKRYTDPKTKLRIKHTNCRVRIPKGLHPRRIKEKLTKKQVGGECIIKREMTRISKDGAISKFSGYHSSEEEEPTGQSRALNKYGSVDHPELQRNEFASHQQLQQKGNMNGWLIEDEDEPQEHEASDNGPNNNNNNNENPDIATIIAHQLQTIIPQIGTQVTNNVNNANGRNGRNGRNNGCTYKGFTACNPKEYDVKGGVIALTRWIEKMENWNTQVQARGRKAAIGMSCADFKALLVEEFFTPESLRIKRYIAGLAPKIRGMLRATQPTTIQSAILRAGILTDEAVSYGILTMGNEKRKGVEESSKQGGRRNENKRAKVSKGFVASTTYRNEND
nr:hypothetical protein [Tanacetum cinerariifolium]